jgi:uncharacterized membrane protein
MKPQEPAAVQSISRGRSRANVVLEAYFDLALVLGFTLITLIFIATPYLNATPVRSIVGLLFILLVPGYASIAAVFPSKTDLGNIERGTLSFGVSIVEGGLVGFGLNYTPWGIGLQSVVIVLLVLTIGGVVVSFRRRNALPPADRFTVSLVEVGSIFKRFVAEPNSRRYRMLNVVIVASLIISLSSLAYLVAMPRNGDTFTALYVLDAAGKTKDYPTNFTLGETKSAVVGVTNDEQREMTYDLVVKLNDSQRATTLYTQTITLANNQTWQDTVPLTPDRTGTDMKLEFLLYRSSDQAASYREAHLWVNVTKS